jgi:Uma2 family endonuclease
VILDEPELHLGDDITVPDIAGWRRERMPEMPGTAYVALPPDWVCEIISPSIERYDRGEKRDVYARHGLKHLWLLDPVQKVLETFELREGLWLLLATHTNGAGADQTGGSQGDRRTEGDQRVAAPPFDAVPLPIGKVWGA